MRFIFLFFLLSCANIVPPSGGPVDTSAPALLSLEPKNNSTKFQDDFIKLFFDENVIIKNNNNIYTSPDFDLIKKIKSNGKEVLVQLKQPLQKNKTYVCLLLLLRRKKKEEKGRRMKRERGPRPPGIDRGHSYDQFPPSFIQIRLQGAEF